MQRLVTALALGCSVFSGISARADTNDIASNNPYAATCFTAPGNLTSTAQWKAVANACDTIMLAVLAAQAAAESSHSRVPVPTLIGGILAAISAQVAHHLLWTAGIAPETYVGSPEDNPYAQDERAEAGYTHQLLTIARQNGLTAPQARRAVAWWKTRMARVHARFHNEVNDAFVEVDVYFGEYESSVSNDRAVVAVPRLPQPSVSPQIPQVELPAGTAITLVGDGSVSSSGARPGELFEVYAAQDVKVNESTAIARCALGQATVVFARPASSYGGGMLIVSPEWITTADGAHISLSSEPLTLVGAGRTMVFQSKGRDVTLDNARPLASHTSQDVYIRPSTASAPAATPSPQDSVCGRSPSAQNQ